MSWTELIFLGHQLAEKLLKKEEVVQSMVHPLLKV
jgi:hypothetical protein